MVVFIPGWYVCTVGHASIESYGVSFWIWWSRCFPGEVALCRVGDERYL